MPYTTEKVKELQIKLHKRVELISEIQALEHAVATLETKRKALTSLDSELYGLCDKMDIGSWGNFKAFPQFLNLLTGMRRAQIKGMQGHVE